MRQLLDDMELALTDLFQMGLSTAGPDMAKRMAELSRRCADMGLHTGGALFGTIAKGLEAQAHSLLKNEWDLAAAVCRAQHYITLCRERMTEEDIRQRWQKGGTR